MDKDTTAGPAAQPASCTKDENEMKSNPSPKHTGTWRGMTAGRGICNSFRGNPNQFTDVDRVDYRGSQTKRRPWVLRAERRRRNKVARASRKRNRG